MVVHHPHKVVCNGSNPFLGTMSSVKTVDIIQLNVNFGCMFYEDFVFTRKGA